MSVLFNSFSHAEIHGVTRQKLQERLKENKNKTWSDTEIETKYLKQEPIQRKFDFSGVL